jgi:urea transport system substrate-binding protein
VGFIKAYDEAGLGADNSPIISVSIAEEEAPAMGVDLTGQYAAWNYFQSVDSPENTTFIEAFQAEYGEDRPTSDPMEAAYTSMYLYKAMVEEAGSFCVDAVNAASDGVSFDAPEGTVVVNGDNHHIAKTGLIGQINADNQFDIVWDSGEPIEPDPFLEGYDWWDPNAG